MLFSGPLWLSWLDRRLAASKARRPWDAALCRNLVVAPLAEEFVFRACMCPLLLKAGWGHGAVVLCCPLFFGAMPASFAAMSAGV